jgi:cathepsin L
MALQSNMYFCRVAFYLAFVLNVSALHPVLHTTDVSKVRRANSRKTGRVKDAAEQALLDFDRFTIIHGKNYQKGSVEYEQHRRIYEHRLEEIRRHNAEPDRLWTAGVNAMSDLSDNEFQMRLGWRHTEHRAHGTSSASSLLEIESIEGRPLPVEVSWANLSMASKVPDQGGCGSCWAVTTANLLSAHYEIHHGKAREFSTQELVSCVQNPWRCGGSGGCEGATVELGLDWAVYNGLRSEGEVPYIGENGRCEHQPFRRSRNEQGSLDKDGRLVNFVKVPVPLGSALADQGLLGGLSLGLTGFRTLETNKYEPLVRALVEEGPVGVTVAANDWSMYSQGVFNGCKDVTLNHAVLLMGIGQQPDGRKWWLIRNSWGDSWGEKGFIKLARSDKEDMNCAEDTSPHDGVACAGGPRKVTVCGTCGILYDSVVPHFGKIESSLLEKELAKIDGDWS